jgi:hypothetical protein
MVLQFLTFASFVNYIRMRKAITKQQAVVLDIALRSRNSYAEFGKPKAYVAQEIKSSRTRFSYENSSGVLCVGSGS